MHTTEMHTKKGAPKELPFLRTWAGSGDARPAWGPLHLACMQAAYADLHALNSVADDDADDLEVWLPGTARLVVRVRNVVTERHSAITGIATVAVDRHGSSQLSISSMRAISAPSPLRWPVLRMRVYPPGRVANFGPISWNKLSAAARFCTCRPARRRA